MEMGTFRRSCPTGPGKRGRTCPQLSNRGGRMNRMFVLCSLAFATVAGAADEKYPIKLPAPGGEVVLPTEGAKKAHDDWRYAAVRRVGDMVYLSGVIVDRR